MKYVVAVLMLLILVVGCAPATTTLPSSTTPPSIAAPVAPPTPPVTTPSAPEPTTPPPAVKVLSFDSATYINDAIGFTWQYPKNWEKQEPYGDTVIILLSTPVSQQSTRVGVFVIAETADLSKAVQDYIKAAGFPIASTVVAPATAITLADGKTHASESIGSLKWIRTNEDTYFYAVGFNKGGKTIVAWGLTVVENKKALIKEIAQTLAVK